MPGDDEGDAGAKTFTQEQVDEAIKEANTALEANRDEVLTDLRKVKDKLKVFDGIDAEEHRKLRTKVAELETAAAANEAGITKAKLDEMRTDVREQLETEYEPFKTRAETAETKVRVLELDNVVKTKMGKAGVRAERIDALFRLIGDRFSLTDDGEPMLTDHAAKDVDKYLAEEVEKEYPEFYTDSGSSGGGASKSTPSGGGRTKTIARDDGDGFLANVEAIAKGEVTVAPE